jgi:hypothetical protein
MTLRTGRRLLRASAFALLLSTVTSVAVAQQRQPISTSLVECAAIYGEVADIGERRGKDAGEVASARNAAVRFSEAALVQAEAEGHGTPEIHLSPIYAQMESKWDGRFANPLRLSENTDWIDYCRALGRDKGVLE